MNRKITPPSMGVTGVEPPGLGGIGGANITVGSNVNISKYAAFVRFITKFDFIICGNLKFVCSLQIYAQIRRYKRNDVKKQELSTIIL